MASTKTIEYEWTDPDGMKHTGKFWLETEGPRLALRVSGDYCWYLVGIQPDGSVFRYDGVSAGFPVEDGTQRITVRRATKLKVESAPIQVNPPSMASEVEEPEGAEDNEGDDDDA